MEKSRRQSNTHTYAGEEIRVNRLIFLRLKATTHAQALQQAKALCKPCNQRSYAGVRWTDASGQEHKWTWADMAKGLPA